ncbi:MAG: response regulator transcription factor [Chloroflexi bacterium]|nr:response regulator transcription factor [Chloroflexota bacterium]MBV9597908.1 response regulator transcription factor [Chloroflexota bacterium]
MTVRVAIVEDEPLYRGLLEQHLAHHPNFDVVGTYADGAAALEGVPAATADVVTVDIELPGRVDGIQTALTLRARDARLGIVILSNHADPRFLGALPREVTSGWSYLLKKSVSNVATLERAIEGAASGTVTLDPAIVAGMRPRPGRPMARLTPRQLEILGLVAQGLSNAAIGERLVLAEKSVENQLTSIYGELGIDRRASAEVHPRVSAVLAYLHDSRISPRVSSR